MAEQRLCFQAEVARLLDIVANALYSGRDVFLRELISNSADACDRLRYEALTRPELLDSDPAFRIRISVDPKARTLSVIDNGIGMNRDELIENLGTIARSGTADFIDKAAGAADASNPLSLIGQFGVGFYSAFMVAEMVEVTSRRAGEEQGWSWRSDGKSDFVVSEAEQSPRGTCVTLYLKQNADEFLTEERIKHIVHTYSDHIAVPILLGEDDTAPMINRAKALWMRPKSEISEDDLREFYHHVAHSFDEPALTAHWHAEGRMEYTALLFVPSSRPLDLFDPKRAHRVRLYVKRVFITEAAQGLIPPWLRFLRGVVDSEDLPLNISREMLQEDPILHRLRGAITRRALQELERCAQDKPETYANIWDNFGSVLKEGLYDDTGGEYRDTLLGLLRFRTTTSPDQPVSLTDYIGRMKPGQDAIWFITGDDAQTLKRSPQIEGFRARGIEVALLTDPVDDFWISMVGAFQDKPFRSVTRGDADFVKMDMDSGAKRDDKKTDEAAPAQDDSSRDLAPLLTLMKATLSDAVKDVRASARLTESAACLVADGGDLDMHLEKLLRMHKQLPDPVKRVLEINPGHPLVQAMLTRAQQGQADQHMTDSAWLLLDQARILEGLPPHDAALFSARLDRLLTGSVQDQ
ncbi:MAG: molecular chaperone HtpG [Alphaproteobacteria bacterium]|nr:MAG: molecular chaperone HtpG [Alphaproteobacteria bacterium]